MTTYARSKREDNGRRGIEVQFQVDLLKRLDKFIKRHLKGRTRSEVVGGMVERCLVELEQ